MRAENRAHRARHPHTVGRLLAVEGTGTHGDRADGVARHEARQQRLRGGVAPAPLQGGGGERRREERARREHAAQLLEDDRQLGHAVAGAAVGLVDVETEPALRGELGPERRRGTPTARPGERGVPRAGSAARPSRRRPPRARRVPR